MTAQQAPADEAPGGPPPAPPPRGRLLATSALALFLELAIIRYLGSEVRILAYFKNLVLIAAFLGFGLGFFRAGRRAALGLAVAAQVAIVSLVGFAGQDGWRWGPNVVSRALAHFAGSITMADAGAAGAATSPLLVASLVWVLGLFLGTLAVFHGYAQRLGTDIQDFGAARRLEAYSWNVLGSLAGILAFAAASWLALGPRTWFVGVLLATLPLLAGWRARLLAAGGAGLVAAALGGSAASATWSPYQRLDWVNEGRVVFVNGTGYMRLKSMRTPETLHEAEGLDRWRLPYRLVPGARSVLVVGAGGGNDVAAALLAGAERVVAVEIDREIYRIGLEHHPDAPYRDPRVEVVIDDARHYAETTLDRFDLVVFSHLDAHEALSAYTNVRLDNYVHTRESFATFRRILRPGGALFVAFLCYQPWVAARLHENLRGAFEREPISLWGRDRHGAIHANYLATEVDALRQRAATFAGGAVQLETVTSPPEPSTDDWPYLFVEARRVPLPMLLLALPLALAACAVVVAAARADAPTASRGDDSRFRWPLDRHFFCLGAAFLLLEVHNVSRLARVFGTTWAVNAWVIGGILLVVLLANLLAARWPQRAGSTWSYVALLATLAAGALVPLDRVVAAPLGPLVVTGLYTAPLLFSGLIFAASFRATPDPTRALGANVLGSVLGGFLELASYVVGLSGLLVIAAVLYSASYRPAARPS